MEEIQDDLLGNIAEGQVYTIRTIVISTIFGGVLAGSFMIYRNFIKFGDLKKARLTILITIVTFIAIFAVVLIPALDQIPNLVYAVVIAIAASVLAKRYQGPLIEQHIAANGKLHSSGRAFLICIVSVVITIAFSSAFLALQYAAMNNI